MNHFVTAVVGVVVACAVVLFLGGMASAWLEIRREKRAGVPVTRPGWERRPRQHARAVVSVPEKALLAAHLPGVAQRLNDRRHGRVSH